MDQELVPVVIADIDDSDGDSSDINERDDYIENGVVNDDEMVESSSSSSLSEYESVESLGQESPHRRSSTRSSQTSDSSGHVHHHHHHHHHRQPTVAYDTSLPAQHSYLGDNLEDLHGRVVFDDDYVTLPLLSLPGLVLVPGQTLPLQLQHPSLIGMMHKIIEKDKTFGLTSNLSSLGTTAEIRSYGVEDEDDGLGVFRVKAEGRQRFLVKETWRQADGILMGKVKILLEIELMSPFEKNSLHFARGSKCNAKLLSVSTPFPKFVYEMYEANVLMECIKNHLENWVSFESARRERSPQPKPGTVKNTQTHVATGVSSTPGSVIRTTRTVTTTIRTVESDDESSEDDKSDDLKTAKTKAPEKPCEFSYWVAANLPLEDARRIEFLSLDCSIQRLRWLLSVLKKYLYICCIGCKSKICHKDDVFSMSVEGPQGAYVNPAGYVHEALTVCQSESLSLEGHPSTEFSWFPGYAWTICSCSRCHSHIGWRFTATNKKLQPELFWAITRKSVELGLKSDRDEVDWKPVI
ncbi:Protein cereblon [Halotydeus destructor]|nr:Protein cereblon [Halotydeus destructor]